MRRSSKERASESCGAAVCASLMVSEGGASAVGSMVQLAQEEPNRGDEEIFQGARK
jgi:hypothetical protein